MLSFVKASAAVATVAAMVGAASAQLSLSSSCETAIAGAAADPNASCLNVEGVLQVAVAAGKNSSLVSPLDSWAKGMCNSTPCTNDNLASLTTTLANACQQDLAQLGMGNITAPQLVPLVQQIYPFAREAVCLQDKPNNTLCATEFLTNLQSVTGPLTLSALEAFGSQIVASAVPNIPASVECTDCTKGWFNIVKQNFPGVVNSDAQQNVQDRCGAAFVDGTTPTTLQAFGNNGTGTSNAAVGVTLSFGSPNALSALALLSSAFALFA